MIAVLGEDRSDAETLEVLVKRIIGGPPFHVKKKWFGGCSELCRKGARCIRQLAAEGVERFVVCHDADGPDEAPIRRKVADVVVTPSGVADSCIVVPVQEIEAWIIADPAAVSQIIPTFMPGAAAQPEHVRDPKEWLVDGSRRANSKPLYVPAIHNPRVAAFLNIQTVLGKCPSFRSFHACVTRW